jgi:aryl-alcohol dehydrogenase-like predicted oxidoreductase
MPLSRRNFLSSAALAPHLVAAAAPSAPAPLRTLGRTGLKVTPVGFGCMITSDPTVIERAVDAGINLFDTARVYSHGNNERMVGNALKPHRQKIVLCSKTVAKSKEGALKDLDTSLAELQTDHLDIWYLHAKEKPEEILPELLEAQEIAKKAGKIRFAGLSTHSGHAEIIPAAIATGKIDVILTTYNFAMGPQMEPIIRKIHAANVGCVAMKVLAGSFKLDAGYDYNRARGVLAKPGAPLAALKWSLRENFIHTAIPSIKDNDQLDENVRALREPYREPDSKILAAQLERISPLYCRMCGSCRGTCPQGLPVQDMLRHLTYADGYGEFSIAREKFLELPEEIRAVRCGDCADCKVKCVNGVRVRERLSRAQEILA